MGTLVDMSGDDMLFDSISTNSISTNSSSNFDLTVGGLSLNTASTTIGSTYPTILSGIGVPTSVSAPKGSLYISATATTATTRLYICTSTASGSSLWAAITSAS